MGKPADSLETVKEKHRADSLWLGTLWTEPKAEFPGYRIFDMKRTKEILAPPSFALKTKKNPGGVPYS